MSEPPKDPPAGSRAAQVLEQLAALRAAYVAALPARAARIATLWARFRQEEDMTAGRMACGDIHRLAGTASLFGLATLGADARKAEVDMECALGAEPTDNDADERLRHVLASMTDPPRNGNSDGP